jgi:beta-N-acetylhexosaminidase
MRSSAAPVTIAAVAAGVLLAGVGAALLQPGPAGPDAAVPTAADPAPPPAPAPAAVPLEIAPAGPPPPAEYDVGDPATWPHRRLAAQLIFSCVQTVDLGTASAHAAAGLGGIAVLGRPTDGPELAAGLGQVLAAAPDGLAPVIASDEEGGRVQRLRGILGALPSAAEMGGWPDDRIERTARDYGAGMRGLGVHMALSPVADLEAPGGHPSDTARAFSADPQRVTGAALAWARGLEYSGVVPVVKHWPGHGFATDSHDDAADVPPLPELEGRDLLPFDAAIAAGAPVVMVGHLRSDGLTEPGVPATLSPNALRVLRERAGPQTVVLTDSMSMGASSAAVGLRPADAAARSLQAGADWALICVDPLAAVDAAAAALDAGAWPRDAAVASARRVLALKERLGLLAVPLVTAAPTGALQSAELDGDVVRLAGSAADPDTPEPPVVRVLVDGAPAGEVVAEAGTGAFSITALPPPGGSVCVEAVNTGAGRSTALGCVTRPAG